MLKFQERPLGQSESVDELDRNGWTICVGISGGIGSEYAPLPGLDSFRKNHLNQP